LELALCRRYGRAEPAPPRGSAQDAWPCGENPGITGRVVFSEGRGLRARVARPYASRGIPFPPDELTTSRWPGGGNVGVGVMSSSRACRARPSRGARARHPCGEDPGITRGWVFSEGRALRVRVAKPHVRRSVPFPPHALTMNRWPKGGNVGVGVVPSLRACGARPSEGGASQGRMALRGKPGDNAKGDFLGGTRSARPQGTAGRRPRHNMIIVGK